MSGYREVSVWIARHRWLVALLFVIFASYTVGKDIAMRDNARDRLSLATDANL